jgi:hypothetical protein
MASMIEEDGREQYLGEPSGVGAEAEFFPWKAVGIRAQVRYKPVFLDDEDSGDFCVPFGFCQGRLDQTGLTVGGIVRF